MLRDREGTMLALLGILAEAGEPVGTRTAAMALQERYHTKLSESTVSRLLQEMDKLKRDLAAWNQIGLTVIWWACPAGIPRRSPSEILRGVQGNLASWDNGPDLAVWDWTQTKARLHSIHRS